MFMGGSSVSFVVRAGDTLLEKHSFESQGLTYDFGGRKQLKFMG